MSVRKFKLENKSSNIIRDEERLLYKLLEKRKNKNNHSVILYEDTLHFYGLWETALLFFDLNNHTIVSPEELQNDSLETIKEYNDEASYKMYNIISYNLSELSPLYLFFYFDGANKQYINTFVFDTTNTNISVDKIKENFQHLTLEDISPDKIKEHILNVHDCEPTPFLFLQKY